MAVESATPPSPPNYASCCKSPKKPLPTRSSASQLSTVDGECCRTWTCSERYKTMEDPFSKNMINMPQAADSGDSSDATDARCGNARACARIHPAPRIRVMPWQSTCNSDRCWASGLVRKKATMAKRSPLQFHFDEAMLKHPIPLYREHA